MVILYLISNNKSFLADITEEKTESNTKNILKSGTRVKGKVISLDENPVYPELKSIKYEYQDAKGKKYISSSSYLTKEFYSIWTIGSFGELSFDKDKPENSIWIGEDWKNYLL
jgi:hypothetical protein